MSAISGEARMGSAMGGMFGQGLLCADLCYVKLTTHESLAPLPIRGTSGLRFGPARLPFQAEVKMEKALHGLRLASDGARSLPTPGTISSCLHRGPDYTQRRRVRRARRFTGRVVAFTIEPKRPCSLEFREETRNRSSIEIVAGFPCSVDDFDGGHTEIS